MNKFCSKLFNHGSLFVVKLGYADAKSIHLKHDELEMMLLLRIKEHTDSRELLKVIHSCTFCVSPFKLIGVVSRTGFKPSP